MSYLLESPDKKERVWTNDRTKYKDWTLLAEGPDSKPRDDCDFDNATKKWIPNPEKKKATKERSKLRCMSKDELARELVEMRERLMKVESLLDQGSVK